MTVEQERLREMLEAQYTPEDLARAGTSMEVILRRSDHPDAMAEIVEIFEREAKAPVEGELAPDFTLPWLPGAEGGPGAMMTLSEHRGRRPVALVFGSYT